MFATTFAESNFVVRIAEKLFFVKTTDNSIVSNKEDQKAEILIKSGFLNQNELDELSIHKPIVFTSSSMIRIYLANMFEKYFHITCC